MYYMNQPFLSYSAIIVYGKPHTNILEKNMKLNSIQKNKCLKEDLHYCHALLLLVSPSSNDLQVMSLKV